MIDVILEFFEWMLRKDLGLGMEVFLVDMENVEMLLWERVVEFLRGVDVVLEMRYLEYVVGELGDGMFEFYNWLVELFVV